MCVFLYNFYVRLSLFAIIYVQLHVNQHIAFHPFLADIYHSYFPPYLFAPSSGPIFAETLISLFQLTPHPTYLLASPQVPITIYMLQSSTLLSLSFRHCASPIKCLFFLLFFHCISASLPVLMFLSPTALPVHTSCSNCDQRCPSLMIAETE